MAQLGSNLAPTWPHLGSTWAHLGAPGSPKTYENLMFLYVFATSPLCGLRCPRWSQDGPKMAPRRPQDGPKSPQGGPKTAPRRLQMAPRWLQDGAKTTSRRPKTTPSRFQVAFRNNLTLANLRMASKLPPRWLKMPPSCFQDGNFTPTWPNLASSSPPRGPTKPHLHHKNKHFLWEGLYF